MIKSMYYICYVEVKKFYNVSQQIAGAAKKNEKVVRKMDISLYE